jgi:nicotinate-nucleotide pyrophosphorylase (carboxylating)
MSQLLSVEELIRLAIQEDVGDGDHTSLATIPAEAMGKAKLLVKEEGILAGVQVAEIVFKEFDPLIKFHSHNADGSYVYVGDIAFEVTGPVRSILTAERLVLNYMQRMSGIASHTFQLVQLLEGLPTRLLDTRKTTPNMRIFEKLAVRLGGGYNHRFGLFDMILIKNNHIDFAGSIKAAVERTKEYLKSNGKKLQIEIEVRNFEELNEVMQLDGIQRVMLDNFSPANLRNAIKIINGKFETEASGGITEQTLREYAETGVDFISVGALTHQIKSLDMSLRAVV